MLMWLSELFGYRVVSELRDVGHVADFLVDVGARTVRYIVITRSGLSGAEEGVALPVAVATTPEVDERRVNVAVSSSEIDGAAAVGLISNLTRDTEEALFARLHYVPYWQSCGFDEPAHLMRATEVMGKPVLAAGEPIGTIYDLMLDGETWQIASLQLRLDVAGERADKEVAGEVIEELASGESSGFLSLERQSLDQASM